MRARDSYLKRPCLGWCVVYGLHAKSSHMYPHPGSFVVMKLNRWRPFGHSQPRQGEKAADIGKAFFPHLGHFIQSPSEHCAYNPNIDTTHDDCKQSLFHSSHIHTLRTSSLSPVEDRPRIDPNHASRSLSSLDALSPRPST
jgi:hypothetical protein